MVAGGGWRNYAPGPTPQARAKYGARRFHQTRCHGPHRPHTPPRPWAGSPKRQTPGVPRRGHRASGSGQEGSAGVALQDVEGGRRCAALRVRSYPRVVEPTLGRLDHDDGVAAELVVAAAPAPVGEVDDERGVVVGGGVEGEDVALAAVEHVHVGLAVHDVAGAPRAGDRDGVGAAGLDGHLARAEAGVEGEGAVGGRGEEADVLAALVDPVLEGAVLEERLGGRAFGPGEEEGGLAGRFGAGAGGVRADPDGVAPRLRRLDDEAGVAAGRVVVAVSG